MCFFACLASTCVVTTWGETGNISGGHEILSLQEPGNDVLVKGYAFNYPKARPRAIILFEKFINNYLIFSLLIDR